MNATTAATDISADGLTMEKIEEAMNLIRNLPPIPFFVIHIHPESYVLYDYLRRGKIIDYKNPHIIVMERTMVPIDSALFLEYDRHPNAIGAKILKLYILKKFGENGYELLQVPLQIPLNMELKP
jgi:hypothetical protein